MNRLRLQLLPLLMLAAIAVGTLAYAMTPQQRREKSRYYYLAGSKQYALENYDAAFELFKKAYDIDSTSKEAGMAYATLLTVIYDDSTYLAKRVFPLMKRYVDTYPDDFQEGVRYARTITTPPMDQYLEGARVLERILARYPSKTELYSDLTTMYFQADSLDKAMETLDRYERIEGRDELSMTRYAAIYYAKNDTASAVRMANELVAQKPYNYKTWMMRANLYGAINQMDSLKTSLEHAEMLEPDNSEIKDALVRYYVLTNDSAMADQKVKEILTGIDIDAQQKIDYLYEYSLYIFKTDSRNERLMSLYDALEEHEGANIDVLEYGTGLSSATADYDRMEHISRTLISLEPTNEGYWENLMIANFFRADSSPVKQQEIFDQAEATLGNTTEKMNMLLSSTYSIDNQNAKAAEVISKYIAKVLPGYSTTMAPSELPLSDTISTDEKKKISTWLQMLADQKINLTDTLGAYNIYEQSLELNPDNVLSLNNYAYFMALSDDADLDKCEHMSQRVMALESDNATYIDTYAYILFRQKKYERAKLYQEMAIEKMNGSDGGESAELYEHYGDILYMCRDYEEALEAWNKALQLNPNSELLQRKVNNKTYYQK